MAAVGEGESEHDFESSSSDSDSSTSDSEENDYQQLVQDIFGDSDSDEEDDFEGFAMEMPENVQWTLRGQPVREHDDLRIADQPDPGPTVILDQNARPLDIFSLFFTDELIDNIVMWTNSNYDRKARLHPNKNRGKWTDTNPDELRAFLAILIIMNDMITVPRLHRYYLTGDNKWFLQIPGIPQIMARDRFKQLKRYLHFCDPNQQQPPANDPTHDRLHKIRPVVTYLQEKFETLYYPTKEIALDESMIPFKGRLKFKQRMPLKPVKNGIKVFVLSESSSGYCYKFEIYLGKDGDEREDAGDLGKTGQVVVRLLRGLQHRGFNVYVDNFYTSIPLFYFLSERGIYACGTIRTNRKHFPKDLLLPAIFRMNTGEFVWATYRNILAMTWKDRKAVSLISTIHDPELGDSVTRRRKFAGNYREVEVPCPKLINDYNKYMGGVDKNDQLAVVRKEMKQLVWYNRIFLKLLEIAVYNSYIIEESIRPHRNQAGKVKRGVLDYKDELVQQLIGNVRAPRGSVGRKRTRQERQDDKYDNNRLVDVGQHFPTKGVGKDHTCLVCRVKKKKWIDANPDLDPEDCPFRVPKTTFCCLGCGEQPRRKQTYLCITRERNCFKDYHSKVEFWK